MSNYPELTAEQYREELQKMIDSITYPQALRYFYIIVSESLKDDAWITRKWGTCHEQ